MLIQSDIKVKEIIDDILHSPCGYEICEKLIKKLPHVKAILNDDIDDDTVTDIGVAEMICQIY